MNTDIFTFVVASAAEAELGALFINFKEGTIIRLILEELGHPKPATPSRVKYRAQNGLHMEALNQERTSSDTSTVLRIDHGESQPLGFIIYKSPHHGYNMRFKSLLKHGSSKMHL